MATVSFITSIRYMKPPRTIEHYRNKRPKRTNRDFFIQYSPSDALRFSIMYHHPPYARYLLEKFPLECLNESVCCPLILLAVQNNEYGILNYLCYFSTKYEITLKGKPYIDAEGCQALEEGKTSLHLAVELGQVDSCRLLLNYNAYRYATDCDGNTPLERAALAYIHNLEYQDRTSKQSNNSQGILQCIIDLMKCETALQQKTRQLLEQIYYTLEKKSIDCRLNSTENVFCYTLNTQNKGPPTLLHLTRCAIRDSVGSSKYKCDSIEQLPLPKVMQQYLELIF